MSDPRLVAWDAVAEAAQAAGFNDFAEALLAADGDVFDRGFALMTSAEPDETLRLEQTDKGQRWRMIRAQFTKWRAGNVTLAGAAGIVRLVLSSAPAPKPWQRAPMARGNTLTVRHGAITERLIAPDLPAAVEDIYRAVQAEMPDAPPLDGLLVERLARALVQLRRMDRFYDESPTGLLDAAGSPRRGAVLYLRVEGRALHLLDSLGIGPAARARLMADKAAGARDAVMAARSAEEELRARYG